MNYLQSLPENRLELSFGRVYYKGGAWYTLHLNGYGYYEMLVDGRSVYGEVKKRGLLGEYKKLKQLDS